MRDFSFGVSELLVPFFLAGIGLDVDLVGFTMEKCSAGGCDPGRGYSVQIHRVRAGSGRLGKVDALRVGVGMIPRGEVGMVVAQIGLGFGIIRQSVYGVVVFMSVATTLVAPPLIKLAYRKLLESGDAEQPEEAFRFD